MHRIGITRHNISGHLDFFQTRSHVFPIRILYEVRGDHPRLILNVVRTGKGFDDHFREPGLGDAATCARFFKVVAETFPRRNGSKVRRILCSDKPLRNRQPRVAGHADPAVAPRLRSRPLNEVVSILGKLPPPVGNIAFRMPHAAGIRIEHNIALRCPESRIGALKLLEPRNRILRNAGTFGNVIQALTAHGFAVGTPGHNRGMAAIVIWTEDIGIDGRAVAHFQSHIFFKHNIAFKGRSAGCSYFTLFEQKPPARNEVVRHAGAHGADLHGTTVRHGISVVAINADLFINHIGQ